MNSMLRDLRFGTGLLARDRAFTVVALATLALTVGANTAIFSAVNAILLRPLPYPDPERLVIMYNQYPNVGVIQGSAAIPDYFDRREETETFAAVALLSDSSFNLGAEDGPERVVGLLATPSLLPLLGARPALGRNLTEAETEPGNHRVVMLSDGLWRERFGAARDVLGRRLRIDSVEHTVVGVLPPGFEVLDERPRLVVPLAFAPEDRADGARHSNSHTLLGRLQPGVTLAQAQERVDALNAHVNAKLPFAEELVKAGFRTAVVPLQEELISQVRPTLVLLQAGVGLVLLIGCVNVANLMLVRSHRRARELAVRFALGAGRARVVRQLLTESLLLGLAGGGLGLAAGVAGVKALATFGVDRLPRGADVGVDGTVLAFTALLALVTGLVFGLIPAFGVTRRDLAEVFRQGGRSGSDGRLASRTRSALVVVQVALAFLLAVGAALMGTSFKRLLDVEPGFATEGILTARLNLPAARYNAEGERVERVGELVRRIVEEVSALPAVTGVGIVDRLPLSGNSNASVISVEGYERTPGEAVPVPIWSFVAPGYFEAFDIPLLAGRAFAADDDGDAPPVAMVDQRLAERYWPGADPIGKRILRGLESEARDEPWYTVVGVVDEVRFADLARPNEVGTVYFSLLQGPPLRLSLVVRTAGPPGALAAPLRRALLAIDPELPLYDVETMETRLADSLASRRTPMLLLAVFAGLALGLAAVGIYGVLAYAVAQRTRELGIRSALGARPKRVLAMVLGYGGRLVVAGLALGLAGALAGTRLLESFLYEVAPGEPKVLALTAAGLAAVALAACLAPAVRAARLDPIVALREE